MVKKKKVVLISAGILVLALAATGIAASLSNGSIPAPKTIEGGPPADEIAVPYVYEGKEEDGKTPHIQNGNWWIGEVDTGIRAQDTDGQDDSNGVSIGNSYVDENLHLWLALSDGSKMDVGYVGDSISTPTTYTVVFKDYDGTVLQTQSVEAGKSTAAPAEPTRDGYIFAGWSTSFDHVDSNLTVVAQYQESTQPILMVQNGTARPGETIQVPVVIQNNPGIAGATIKLTYDERLTLTHASAGDAFAQLDYTAPYRLMNPCKFNWDSLSGAATSDGTVLLLTFTVPSNVHAGDELKIACSYATGDIYDENLDDITLQVIGGKVTIQ